MTSLIALPMITLLTGLALAIPRLTPPTVPFGVRVAAVRAKDPAILRVRQTYMFRVAVAAMIALVVCLVAYDNVIVAGIFANALIAIHGVVYALANRQLRAIKRQEWWQAEHRYGVTTDITFRTDPVRVPLLWLSPAVVVLLATMLLGRWDLVIPMAAMTVLMPLLVRVLMRARPVLDAAQPVGSSRRYRAYLRGTARMMLLMVAAVNLVVLLTTTPGWEIVSGVVMTAFLIGLVVWMVRVGHAGHRLRKLPGEEDEDTGLTQRDDDKHWYMGGTLYANRQDRAVLVHHRVGMSWTLNMGHPVTWTLLAALALLVALAGFGVIDLPARGEGF